MHPIARIVRVAAVVASALLLGMRQAPQDGAPKTTAAERHEAAKEIEKLAAQAREQGFAAPWEAAAQMETRVLWSRRFAEAAVDAGAAKARDAFAQHVARVEAMLSDAKQRFDAGGTSAIDVALARYHVADAKLLAERVK